MEASRILFYLRLDYCGLRPISELLLGFRHIIRQMKAYNFLYQLLYLKY